MYKLIGSKKSRAFRVLWALEELELEYEFSPVLPRSDEIRAVNPSGKVPALLVDGEVLLDSVAIIQFLADKHGKLTYPAGTIERAKQDGFTQFINDEMDGCLWTAARNTFILPEDKRIPQIKTALRWEFGRSMDVLAERLGDREWLMGDTFTIADIVAAHCGTWARGANFEISQPNVNAYIDRAVARPAWKRATDA
ncbi:MAG: glutathione S-transferase family protein [Rhodobacteraceae bacterium]|nr:glutathione S-transferase family protein [Paracoccaceae bacterium]